MALVVTDNKHYTDIANAIREKNGEEILYLPSEMAESIRNIQTGSTGPNIYTITLDPGERNCYQAKLSKSGVILSTYEKANLNSEGKMIMCANNTGTYVVYLYTSSTAGARTTSVDVSDDNPHVTVTF